MVDVGKKDGGSKKNKNEGGKKKIKKPPYNKKAAQKQKKSVAGEEDQAIDSIVYIQTYTSAVVVAKGRSRNAKITSYAWNVSTKGAKNITVTTEAPAIYLNSLKPGTIYQVVVTILTGKGQKSQSFNNGFHMPKVGDPFILDVVPKSFTTALLTFSASPNHAPYKVNLESNKRVVRTDVVPRTTVLLEGLDASSYKVTVTADGRTSFPFDLAMPDKDAPYFAGSEPTGFTTAKLITEPSDMFAPHTFIYEISPLGPSSVKKAKRSSRATRRSLLATTNDMASFTLVTTSLRPLLTGLKAGWLYAAELTIKNSVGKLDAEKTTQIWKQPSASTVLVMDFQALSATKAVIFGTDLQCDQYIYTAIPLNPAYEAVKTACRTEECYIDGLRPLAEYKVESLCRKASGKNLAGFATDTLKMPDNEAPLLLLAYSTSPTSAFAASNIEEGQKCLWVLYSDIDSRTFVTTEPRANFKGLRRQTSYTTQVAMMRPDNTPGPFSNLMIIDTPTVELPVIVDPKYGRTFIQATAVSPKAGGPFTSYKWTLTPTTGGKKDIKITSTNNVKFLLSSTKWSGYYLTVQAVAQSGDVTPSSTAILFVQDKLQVEVPPAPPITPPAPKPPTYPPPPLPPCPPC